MRVYLVDGTYELFRHFYAIPSNKAADGVEVAATRGVLSSMIFLLRDGVTHLGVATDQVIESFRNDLWPGYKNGAGIDPELFRQFPIIEEALTAMGVLVWAMVKYEADDALAAAAAQASLYAEQVLICTPDKDLAQCVVDDHVVQFDRRANRVINTEGVVAKFGVLPGSIPDYLALVGDSADGFPGLPGWGAKSAAAVLAKFGIIEAVPDDPADWGISVRGAAGLGATLREHRDRAMLFKDLATLRTDIPINATAASLEWRGPTQEFRRISEYLGVPELADQAEELAWDRR
jgi:5'-3' exonuclease